MSLPRKVREQAEAAEAALAAITEPPPEPAPDEQVEAAAETQPNPEVVETVASEAVTEEPQVEALDAEAKWEERYKVLQGKYNAEIPRLQEELKKLREQAGSQGQESALRAEIEQLKTQIAQPAEQAYEPPSNAMIDKIRDDYGSDLAEVFAAMQSENNKLSQQLSDLANQTTQMQTTSTDQAFRAMLEAQGIDFDQANNDPLFIAWLDEVDQFSGLARSQLLNSAYTNGDLRRAANFFSTYYGQMTTTKNESKPKPSLDDQVRVESEATKSDTPAPEQPVWTQAQITEYYNNLRRGMYTPEEAQRLENQLFAALRG